MYGCPGKNKLKTVTHRSFSKVEYTNTKWGWFETAFNCKVAITGAPSMNGKLTVEIQNVDDATLYIYLQPNNFNEEEMKTVGIIENNKVYNHYSWTKAGRRYTVPSDWTIFLVYNVGYVNGGISVKSWVSPYTEKDLAKIAGSWQPTGTYWVNATAIALEKAAQEERERKAEEDRQRKIKAAKTEAERLRAEQEAEAARQREIQDKLDEEKRQEEIRRQAQLLAHA